MCILQTPCVWADSRDTLVSLQQFGILTLKNEMAKGCRTELPEKKCRSFESWKLQPAWQQASPHSHYGMSRLREKGRLWGKATITGWNSSVRSKKWETTGTEARSRIGRVCTKRKDFLWSTRDPAMDMPKNQRDDLCRVWNNI